MDARSPSSTREGRWLRLRHPALAIVITTLAISAAMILGGWDSCSYSRAPTEVRTLAPAAQPSHYAWTVGGAGVIQATRTGGSAWNGQASGTTAGLSDVAFPDARNGWAVGSGDNGVILATQDGGATWTAQNAATGAVLKGVAFSDPTHGWAVGSYGAIVATASGGTYWSPQTSGTSEGLYDVAFSDARHGWAVGASGTIIATADGGDA